MPGECDLPLPDAGGLTRGRFTYFPVVPGRLEFASHEADSCSIQPRAWASLVKPSTRCLAPLGQRISTLSPVAVLRACWVATPAIRVRIGAAVGENGGRSMTDT